MKNQTYEKTDELQNIQNNLLSLLKVFHMYCLENNVKYSLHGGTLLGAIREKGFIPWDDDIDITMTRKEYIRFVSLVHKKGLPMGLTLNERQPIIKIIMRSSGNLPVWIDIFVWDYISENILLQRMKIYGIMFFQVFIRNLESLKRTKAHAVYTGLSLFTMKLIVLIGCPFSYDLKLKWMKRFFEMLGGHHTLVHRANDQLCGINLILPADIMDSYILVPFEDGEFYVSSKYKQILESTYGKDYMIPQYIEFNHNDSREDLLK